MPLSKINVIQNVEKQHIFQVRPCRIQNVVRIHNYTVKVIVPLSTQITTHRECSSHSYGTSQLLYDDGDTNDIKLYRF